MTDRGQTPGQKAWHFGPDWPGKRCGAKTRQGTPCQKPALHGKRRCKLHGSGGAPCGEENGHYKHGGFTKRAVKHAREARERVRALEVLGRMAGLFD